MVFDEQVFPFSSLHPNAGSRLRSELALLPDVLLNPSSSFGDVILHDQHLSSPVSTDPLSSSGRSPAIAGIDAVENGERTASSERYSCVSWLATARVPRWIRLLLSPHR